MLCTEEHRPAAHQSISMASCSLSGAQYELKVARQAEARFKARELEGRMMREQVGGSKLTMMRDCLLLWQFKRPFIVLFYLCFTQARQARKEKDPEHQAREAEIQAIQQHLLAQRERKGVEAAQRDVLRCVFGRIRRERGRGEGQGGGDVLRV